MTDNRQGLILDKHHSALLLMDFQRDIVSPGGKLAPDDGEVQWRFQAAIDATAAALDAARQSGLPVIHVRVAFTQGAPPLSASAPLSQYFQKVQALEEGSEGAEFHPDLKPHTEEQVFTKRGISAFATTRLGEHLAECGVNTVVLAGIVTHWVVEGTARDAYERDLRAIVLGDCCASGSEARHRSALDNVATIGTVTDSNAFVRSVMG